MADFAGTERFSVVRLLGKGGYGNVYEVIDQARGERKALKVLHQIDPEGVFRLKSEFRALVDLSHPNLVRLEELFAEGSSWYMTLELISGVPLSVDVQGEAPANGDPGAPAFDDYITVRPGAPTPANPHARKRRGRPFNEDKLRGSLRQLVDALNYLHQAGLCHRDLKPSNVLVEKNGRVVLVDFGLSQSLFAPPAGGKAVEGTPAYMSPEQLAGEAVGPASDWYAVGVMLYEALTGVLPHDGSNLYMAMQKAERPRSPHELVADLPYDLVQLCIELLSPNPADRPTGKQLSRRVNRRQTPRVMPAVADPTRIDAPTELHGADEALTVWALAYEEVRHGAKSLVEIAGASGSGKSTLMKRLLDRLREAGTSVTILSARCRVEESLRYRTIDGLVDQAVEWWATQPEGARPDPAALAALTPAFPVVGRLAPPPPPEPEPSLDAIATALVALFEPLGRGTVLVLAVDDLSSGDADGAALLGRLLSGLPGVLALAATRSDGEPAPSRALKGQLHRVGLRRVLL